MATNPPSEHPSMAMRAGSSVMDARRRACGMTTSVIHCVYASSATLTLGARLTFGVYGQAMTNPAKGAATRSALTARRCSSVKSPRLVVRVMGR